MYAQKNKPSGNPSAEVPTGVASSLALKTGVMARGRDQMALVADFHTSSTEDGDKLVYHNQSECGYGKEIIKNGNKVADRQPGDTLCDACTDLAAGK